MKTFLFKPFEKYTESRLLLVGMVSLLVGTTLAFFFQTRFDGALDIHFSVNVSWKMVLVDLVVTLFSLFVFLYLAGILLNGKTRAVDIVLTVLIARIPLYLTTLINIGGEVGKFGEKMKTAALKNQLDFSAFTIVMLVVSIFVMLPLLVWSVALLWNGYKVSANAKGANAVLLFIGAIVLAEVASKIILYVIYN